MTSAKDFGLTVVRSSGNEENIVCPFHEDSAPSATYNKAKGLFYCFVCGTGYNNQQLAEKLGLEWEDVEDSVNILEDFDLLSEESLLEMGDKCVSNEYLTKRGIDSLIADFYEIRYKGGMFPAVVLPVTTLKGITIGAVYRHTASGFSRYIKVGKMTPIWPMHILNYYDPGRPIIVTEGAFSAMRLATVWSDFHFPEKIVLPVATLGAMASQEILDVLSHLKPIFLYDDDEAGNRACRKMRKISRLCKAYTLSTSPDDMDTEQLSELAWKVMELAYE
jgi:DNA primase